MTLVVRIEPITEMTQTTVGPLRAHRVAQDHCVTCPQHRNEASGTWRMKVRSRHLLETCDLPLGSQSERDLGPEDACLRLPACVKETAPAWCPSWASQPPQHLSGGRRQKGWEAVSLGPPSAEGKGEGARPLIVEAGLVPEAGFKRIVPANGSIPSGFCSTNNHRQA